MTPLDTAHVAAETDPDNEGLRLRFYERLADAELFVVLETAPDGKSISPQLYDLEDGRFALAFDLEDRMAAFIEDPTGFATVSGRSLVAQLASAGIGVALNLGDAPSSQLIPATAVSWLAERLATVPDQTHGEVQEILSADTVPDEVIDAIEQKFAAMAGAANATFLVKIQQADTARNTVVFVGAPEPLQRSLAASINETLAFCGDEAPAFDVAFFANGSAAAVLCQSVGVRLRMPAAPPKLDEKTAQQAAIDRSKVPILK